MALSLNILELFMVMSFKNKSYADFKVKWVEVLCVFSWYSPKHDVDQSVGYRKASACWAVQLRTVQFLTMQITVQR